VDQLLFIIYTNDLPHALIHSKCILSADNTTIYSTSQNRKELEQNTENDMRALSDWFYANKLSFNVQKTTFVVFSPKNTNNNTTSITLGNKKMLNSQVFI